MSTHKTEELVTYVAHLARLELKEQELHKLALQLEDILGFIAKLNEADIKDIAPTSHILPVHNVLRDDVPGESLPAHKALENAPSREGDSFTVPRVIE